MVWFMTLSLRYPPLTIYLCVVLLDSLPCLWHDFQQTFYSFSGQTVIVIGKVLLGLVWEPTLQSNLAQDLQFAM